MSRNLNSYIKSPDLQGCVIEAREEVRFPLKVVFHDFDSRDVDFVCLPRKGTTVYELLLGFRETLHLPIGDGLILLAEVNPKADPSFSKDSIPEFREGAGICHVIRVKDMENTPFVRLNAPISMKKKELLEQSSDKSEQLWRFGFVDKTGKVSLHRASVYLGASSFYCNLSLHLIANRVDAEAKQDLLDNSRPERYLWGVLLDPKEASIQLQRSPRQRRKKFMCGNGYTVCN